MKMFFLRTVTIVFFAAALLAQTPAPIDSMITPAVVQDSHTAPIPAPPSAQLHLPEGLRVELVLKTKVSSDTSKVGDVVELEVVKPVMADGLVAIAQDTPATARVVVAEPRRRKGIAGKLAIRFDGVQLVNGDRVTLSGRENRQGKDARQEIDSNMGEWTLRTFGFGAPLAPLFLLQKGGKAEVGAGTRLSAYVGSDLAVERSVLERNQPARRQDVAAVYLVGVWHPTCGSQELPYDDYQKGVSRIDLPPGEYWFHNGAFLGLFRAVMVGSVTGFTMGAIAPDPISVRKVLKRPLREFTMLKVQGGSTYYLRSHPKNGKPGLEQLDPTEGEKILAENDAAYFRIHEVTPEMLKNLAARPELAPAK